MCIPPKKIFNKTIFEENARRLGLKLTPVSESVDGGIFFKENLNDEFKKLTFDNFLKKDLLGKQVKLTDREYAEYQRAINEYYNENGSKLFSI